MAHDAIHVFFFGDSICFGQGVSLCHGWVPRVAAACDTLGKEVGTEVAVFNPSVNGNTTRMALERMPKDIQEHSCQVLVVQYGLNDCNHWDSDGGLPRVSPLAFEANLHEILDRGKKFGARRMFLHTNHPTTRTTEPMPRVGITYEESNRRYNEIVRRVAGARTDVELVDVEVEIRALMKARGLAGSDIVLADRLHLSKTGHDLYYEIVRPRILAGVRKLLSE